jgi:proteasome accessory factor C
MIEQKTTLCILQLLENLRRRKLTLNQIKSLTGKSRSTVFKYLEVLRKLNFNVRLENEYYSIVDIENSEGNTHEFIDEERLLIQEALLQFAPDNPLRNNILLKIDPSDNLALLADSLVRQQDIESIRRLTEAIRTKKRVILRGYDSNHSNRLSERLVEPKIFLEAYQQIYCCEVESQSMKTFNIERIGSIEILKDQQSLTVPFERDDVFGMRGFEEHVVELRLTKRAKLILENEYPKTRNLIRDDGGGRFHIRTTYTLIEGVGRFCLSLPGEIEVINDSHLRNYLNEQIQRLENHKW